MPSAEQTAMTSASPQASVAGDGKGVKRSQEEATQQQQQQQQQQQDTDGVPPPPMKSAKLADDRASVGTSANEENGRAGTATAATAVPPSVAPTVASSSAAVANRCGPTDSEKVEAEELRSLGLAVGSRLEVMWILEDDDKSTEKWWGCSVVGAKTGERDGEEGRPVFTLHYDAYQTFEEADHDVCFVDKYRLVHLEDGAEMTWKQEGEEMNREAVMASLADEKVNLQEVMAAQKEEDEESGGESIESQGMRELAQLPQHQQVAMAAGYRRMADVVKQHLAKIQEQHQSRGGEAVVSAADVENMFRDVRAGIGGPGSG